MKIRLTCPSCHASFLATDEQLGGTVPCPKCGANARMPSTREELERLAVDPSKSPGAGDDPEHEVAPVEPAPAASRFDPRAAETEDREDRRRRRPWLIPSLVGAVAVLAIAAIVLRPAIRRAIEPEPAPAPAAAPDLGRLQRPVDPLERLSRQWLDAVVEGDSEAIDALSTVEEPPAIASFSELRRDPEGDVELRGSFAPIAELNDRIGREYTYNEAIDRFENANPLGTAADFMDGAEALRDESVENDVYTKMASGDPDEALDAIEGFLGSYANLTKTVLPRTKLAPKYEQLVEDAEPALPEDSEALALRFGEDKETWDELLGRPFFTIEADGPYIYEEAEVVATVRDRLASPGDPPRPLRLTFRRFRLDAIDTGWKVVSARRESPTPSSEESISPGLEVSPGLSAGVSPGDRPPSPGELDPAGQP